MAWRNRTSLTVLLEHFPSLAEAGEGKMVGWCPCPHPEGAPTEFFIHLMEDSLWAIDFCVFGDAPSEIWEASRQPREAGEDDGKKPGLERFAYVPSILEMRADPPHRQYLLKVARTGVGVMKLGEVFMLAATGGMGKSNALMQLNVAVSTGTNWFGAGRGWAARQGRALSLFAEEDPDEIKRRLHFAIKASGLTSDEDLQMISDNLVLMAMRGESVVLCGTLDKSGIVTVTERAIDLLTYLREANARGRPFTLVSVDPLARFAGADAESSNAAATKFVELCEQFTKADCGRPSVGCTHHLRKVGIAGEPDDLGDTVRGSSALKNGTRWTAVMSPPKKGDGYAVKLTVPKNNHGPKPDPLTLAYVEHCEGMLIAIDPPSVDDKLKANIAIADEGLMVALENEIRARGPDSGRHLARRVKVGNSSVGLALDQMLVAGRVVKEGAWKYALPRNPVPEPVLDLFRGQKDPKG